jgi:hypothetical protein
MSLLAKDKRMLTTAESGLAGRLAIYGKVDGVDDSVKQFFDETLTGFAALCRTAFFKQLVTPTGVLVVIEIRFPLFVKYHRSFAKLNIFLVNSCP